MLLKDALQDLIHSYYEKECGKDLPRYVLAVCLISC